MRCKAVLCANGRQAERGLTLIEVMVTLAVGMIVMAILVSTIYVQQRNYARQLDFLEAQQNARASIALLKRYLRMAGWGIQPATAYGGVVPIGACARCSDMQDLASCSTPLQQQLGCDNVELDGAGASGSDRIRVIYFEPDDGRGYTHDEDNNLQSGATLTVSETTGHPLEDGAYALLSGACNTGSAVDHALDFVTVGSGNCPGGGAPCTYTLVSNLEGGASASCDTGYQSGFSLGRAQLADFWVDRTDPAHPELKLRLGPSQTLQNAYTVAYDVDDLQAQYGIDTTDPPDGVVDLWCDDPSQVNTDCPSGFLDASEHYPRMLAVRVAIVVRTRTSREELTGGLVTKQVMNHTFTFSGDGFARWIYRATIALRNNNL